MHFLVLGGLTKMCEILFDIACDSDPWRLPTTQASIAERIGSLAKFCKSDRKCEVHGAAIHFSAWENDDDLFHLLLRHGANVNEIDSEGRKPIHIAAGRGSLSKLTLLCTWICQVSIVGATTLFFMRLQAAVMTVSHFASTRNDPRNLRIPSFNSGY